MILVGIRSPIVVEYEETLRRLNRPLTSAISVNGTPRLLDTSKIVSLDDFERNSSLSSFLSCAFIPSRRKQLVEIGRSLGLLLAPALIDPTAIVARSVRIDNGTFVNAGAVIGAASMIGEGALINRAVSLGHHTLLGDFTSIGPGATLAGNIHVGDDALIGAGSTILPNIRIGAGAIIAAGSLVRKNVPDGVFVAGNPAKEREFNPSNSSLHVDNGE